MVSELDGGQPPSPVSLPSGAAALEAPHPAGTVSVARSPLGPPPRPPSPTAAPQLLEEAEDMQLDAPASQTLMRSTSPASRQASPMVPVHELGGGGQQQQQPAQQPAALEPQQEQQQQEQQPASSSLGGSPPHEARAAQGSASLGCSSLGGELGGHPDRPASPTGYESGDDMDLLSVRHCTNCTGTLWGHICMDCGHMPAHDADIFEPTVAPASALHRPRLQGDAAAVICWDERMELHEEAGPCMHPERPDRVRAVMARLHAAELAGRCRRLPAREASDEEVTACHIPELLEAVDLLSEQSRLAGGNGLHFSPDTYVNEHTALCARLSAGACVDVARAVATGDARAGVAVVRPPGHHAESNTAMGFCFFNNAGIAARAAQAAGAGRVLVLDWDVHHGNGTQHIFEDDPSVLYISLHRYDGGSFYPGTGAAHEVGEGGGEGFNVNVPWPCGGLRNGDYLAAFQHVVLPIAYEFAPDLVVISAGFDAAEGDPIGGCHLTPEAYAHMAAQLQLVAPTVALLEGGYNLLSTAAGTEAVVRVLLGERPPPLPAAEAGSSEFGLATIAQVMRIQARYWSCMRGLVAQQFKVLAAAAARQEQLAAMKQRRADVLGAGRPHSPHSPRHGLGVRGDASDGEDEGMQDEHSRGAGLGASDDEEEEERRLMAQAHRRPPGLDLDGADTDTPHQEYRAGSGWESDADLASDEEPLSGASDASEGEAPEARSLDAPPSPQQQQQQQPAPEQQQQDDDASPARGASEAQWASDTAPISDSEAQGSAGSGCASDGTHQQQQQQQQQAAGLTSGSLSPPDTTPAAEPALAAAMPPAPRTEVGAQAEAAGAAAAGERSAPAWPGLSIKVLPLKRPGHVSSHQRLSPALLDDEALALVHQKSEVSSEHVVPQQP